MSNHYIENSYTADQLLEKLKQLESKLTEVGTMYNLIYSGDGIPADMELTLVQTQALESHRDGYDLNVQIHHIYAEIGAIMEAQEHIGVLVELK